MTTLQKSVLALVGVVLLVGAYGGYKYLLTPAAMPLSGAVTTGQSAGGSLLAETGLNLTNSTTTSILNTDSQDRFIVSNDVYCSALASSQAPFVGGGIANLTITAATTSTGVGSSTNTNFIVNENISTTTAESFIASSTNGAIFSARRWGAGSYLQWSTNATNTAQCTVDVWYRQGLGA